MNSVKQMVLGVLLIFMGGLSGVYAQTDGFDPANPSDPGVPVFKEYRAVTVALSLSDAGSVSRYGSAVKNGKYEVGTSVNISTSGNYDFTFIHWTKNGEVYCDSPSFTYTVEEKDANFVAVYEYTPHNPSDPALLVKSRVTLQCEPAEACSFTQTSGAVWEVDSWLSLGVNPNQDYEFQGWYDGSNLISSSPSFYYLVPYKDVKLTARFKYNWIYNPANPDDPASQGGNIQNDATILGDVNGDKVVNVTDAIEIINAILANKTGTLDKNACDMNRDGQINVTDAIEIINLILKGK